MSTFPTTARPKPFGLAGGDAAPLIDRMPPHDLSAEAGVLGSMIIDPQVIGPVCMFLQKPDMFFKEENQIVFRVLSELFENNTPIDAMILHSTLKTKNLLEQVGGIEYIKEMANAVPTSAHAEYYAAIVKEKAMLRSLITACTTTLRDCYESGDPAATVLDRGEGRIFEIAQQKTSNQAVPLTDVLHETFEMLDRQTGEHFSGIESGFIELDNLTSGLQRGEMIIIAARPSVGKTSFAMNIVEHVGIDKKKACAVFSLEMSKQQLAQRMLCSRSGVDSHKLRRGMLSKQDRDRLSYAVGDLSKGQIFIDDTPGLTLMDLRTKARRLKLQYNIELVALDYLQLMECPGKADNRQQEIATISRGVKALARELNVPVLCLSQLNRASESEQRLPRTSDLRESGCLAGDTLITLADSGVRVPIRDLAGKSPFRVWAMNGRSLKLEVALATNAFSTGRKPVFRIETRLGRVIRATANHRFYTLAGWMRLDELKPKVEIALPRHVSAPNCDATVSLAQAALLGHLIGDGCTLPRHSIQYTTRELDLAETVVQLAKDAFGEALTPRIHDERTKVKTRRWYQVFLTASEHLTHRRTNPVSAWLRDLGVFGLRSYEKFVPDALFRQPASIVSIFLRHLWATDGCIRPPSPSHGYPSIYYASSSNRLAFDVQALLLRLGINAVVKPRSQGTKGRTQYHVMVMGREDILGFARVIGAVGEYKKNALGDCVDFFDQRAANTNRDLIPRFVWRAHVVPALQEHAMSTRAFQRHLGHQFCGNALYKASPSRDRMARIASVLPKTPILHALAASDLYWDRIVSITPDGDDEVFDLTVPEFSNFIANDIVVHNSIEQDADVVMLLHREAVMHRGDQEWMDANPDKINEALIIVAKQRNGPCDNVKLTFMANQTRFVNYNPGV